MTGAERPEYFLLVVDRHRTAECVLELDRDGWRRIRAYEWENDAGQRVKAVTEPHHLNGWSHGTKIIWGPRLEHVPRWKEMADSATCRGFVDCPMSDLGPEKERQ